MEAARRWRHRSKIREDSLAALSWHDYIEADDERHLRKWCDRQLQWLSALGADEDAGIPDFEDVNNALVERIIEVSDLLSVEFFELGPQAAACVGRVVTEGEFNGTSFLVAPGLMLTNHHVLRSNQEGAASELEMDFEENKFGPAKPVHSFLLEPDRFFLTDAKLDFTLVSVRTESQTGLKLAGYRFLPLVGEQGKVRVGQEVNIVQHPRGKAKQVVVRNNRLVDLPDGAGDYYFHYKADTEKGSSGSPVFNDRWEVVALHHSGVPLTDEHDRKLDRNGTVVGDDEPERFVWIGNEGIRISRIVRAVQEANLSPEMSRVRTEAIKAWESRGSPRISEALADNPGITANNRDRPEEAAQKTKAEPRLSDEAPRFSGDPTSKRENRRGLGRLFPIRVQFIVDVGADPSDSA